MKEEVLIKITQLQEEIKRLEREYNIYKEHDEETSESIKYNIDKRKWEIEELLTPIKQELKEKEDNKNRKIEEIRKEAEERIERLEKEYNIYKEYEEETSEPIKYNIDKIKWELEDNVKTINTEYEEEKNNILNKIQETGIDVEEYGLIEKENEVNKGNQEKEYSSKAENIENLEEIDGQNIESEKTPQNTKESKIEEKETGAQIINPIISTTKTKNEQIRPDFELQKNATEEKISNESVKIIYSAKYDKYIIKDLKTKEEKIFTRKNMLNVNKELLAQKMGKDIEDLKDVDLNVLQILLDYDKQYNTQKAMAYFDTMILTNKKEIKKEMEENKIDIEYDLKGLYDKNVINNKEKEDKFTIEERREILDVSNIANKKGIAIVKKGPKVALRELVDKIIRKSEKIKLLPSKNNLRLPQTKREKKKQEEYSKLVNKEYMQSLDSDFEKALKEEHFKNRIKSEVKVKAKPSTIIKNTKEINRDGR